MARFIQLTALVSGWTTTKKTMSVNLERVLTVMPAESGATIWFGGADKIEVEQRYEEVVRMMFEANALA